MTVACGSHQNIGIDDKFWCVIHIADDVSIRTDWGNVNQIFASKPATSPCSNTNNSQSSCAQPGKGKRPVHYLWAGLIAGIYEVFPLARVSTWVEGSSKGRYLASCGLKCLPVKINLIVLCVSFKCLQSPNLMC